MTHSISRPFADGNDPVGRVVAARASGCDRGRGRRRTPHPQQPASPPRQPPSPFPSPTDRGLLRRLSWSYVPSSRRANTTTHLPHTRCKSESQRGSSSKPRVIDRQRHQVRAAAAGGLFEPDSLLRIHGGRHLPQEVVIARTGGPAVQGCHTKAREVVTSKSHPTGSRCVGHGQATFVQREAPGQLRSGVVVRDALNQ